jgi:hypothetical protein
MVSWLDQSKGNKVLMYRQISSTVYQERAICQDESSIILSHRMFTTFLSLPLLVMPSI